MSTNAVWWIGFCAAAMLMASQCSAADEGWRAVEQPELEQALEQAPLLQTESLGEPARGVNVWERWFVPNPDGKTWDVLQWYFKDYWGPTWLYAVGRASVVSKSCFFGGRKILFVDTNRMTRL
jgi:hypothetical protein